MKKITQLKKYNDFHENTLIITTFIQQHILIIIVDLQLIHMDQSISISIHDMIMFLNFNKI